jgi:hypothetical protein
MRATKRQRKAAKRLKKAERFVLKWYKVMSSKAGNDAPYNKVFFKDASNNALLCIYSLRRVNIGTYESFRRRMNDWAIHTADYMNAYYRDEITEPVIPSTAMQYHKICGKLVINGYIPLAHSDLPDYLMGKKELSN